MTAYRKISTRHKKVLIIIFFIALWVFVSNETKYQVTFGTTVPLLSNLTFVLHNQFFELFGVVLPFLFVIGMLLVLLFYYSNQISRRFFRRLFKIILLLIILFGFYIAIGTALETLPAESDNNNGSSTVITTTLPTSGQTILPTTTSTTLPANTSTSTSSTTSTIFTTRLEPLWQLQLLIRFIVENFVFLIIGLVALIILGSFFRPKVPVESRKLEKSPKKASFEYHSRDKPREQIISAYLHASALLEQLGADDDYSLTPKEFESDVEKKFKEEFWLNFPELTFWYEIARFSDKEIPESAVDEVNAAIDRLNEKYRKLITRKADSKLDNQQ